DAAKRAEALAATGGSDEETYRRAREVLGDMQMLANLENVRVRSTQNEAGFDLNEEDRGNARAFRAYGIDIDALDRGEAAKRIRARPIRYELAVLLDSWSYVRHRLAERGSKQIGKGWKELLQVARAADPDPWRDRFRKAVLNGDRKALVEVAASAPFSSLPAETVDRLGSALMDLRAVKEAAAFLQNGQRLHPQDYWINVNLGICLVQLGQLDDAIRYQTAAVALRPEAAVSYSNLGEALRIRGKLDEALATDSKAIELQPKRARWWNERGLVYYGLRQWDKALADFVKASELLPKAWGLWHNQGSAYVQMGQLARAVAAFSKAIDLKPDNADSWHHRGMAHGRLGQKGKALDDFTRAIELKPREAMYWHNRANVYAQMGQHAKAVADFSKA